MRLIKGQIEKHRWGLLDKEGEDTNHGYMKNSNQTCFTSFALIEDDPDDHDHGYDF